MSVAELHTWTRTLKFKFEFKFEFKFAVDRHYGNAATHNARLRHSFADDELRPKHQQLLLSRRDLSCLLRDQYVD